MDNPGLIAENIKYLRTMNGISQSELAKAMGVAQSSVAQWENAARALTVGMIAAFAKYFGVSLDDLVFKKLTPKPPLIASNLKTLRESHGFERRSIGGLLGVRESRVRLYEEGKEKMSKEQLLVFAEFFGITPEALEKEDFKKGRLKDGQPENRSKP